MERIKKTLTMEDNYFKFYTLEWHNKSYLLKVFKKSGKRELTPMSEIIKALKTPVVDV